MDERQAFKVGRWTAASFSVTQAFSFFAGFTPTGMIVRTKRPVTAVHRLESGLVRLARRGAQAALSKRQAEKLLDQFAVADGYNRDSVLTSLSLMIRFVGNLSSPFFGQAIAGQPSRRLQLFYDHNFLYFAFRCVDDNIWSTLKRRDEHLWDEEVVEVFLQPDPSQPGYIELEVNPLGTMLDIYLLGVRKPLHYESWNSEKLRWGVQVFGTVDGKPGDHEWTCEIAIPMEDMVTAPHLPPLPGDRWRMNLYRAEHLPTPAGLAWSPTLRDDFHIPLRFGEIVFMGP